MATVSFYSVTNGDVERTVARLLEKVYQAGHRIVLWAETDEKLEFFNSVLWTFSSAAFVPHGTKEDGFTADQPILLTTTIENPNEANVLVLVDPYEISDFGKFQRCLDLFNAHDELMQTLALERMKAYKKAGHEVLHWVQDPTGKWEKQN